MTQLPDIKISDAAQNLALSIWNDRSICSDTDQDTFLILTVPTIQTALNAAAAEGRRLALKEAADKIINDQYPCYGDAKRISETIRNFINKPSGGEE